MVGWDAKCERRFAGEQWRLFEIFASPAAAKKTENNSMTVMRLNVISLMPAEYQNRAGAEGGHLKGLEYIEQDFASQPTIDEE
jgi:hypothetical protein